MRNYWFLAHWAMTAVGIAVAAFHNPSMGIGILAGQALTLAWWNRNG